MNKTNNTFFLTLLIALLLAGSSALSSAQEQAQQGGEQAQDLPLIKIWDVTMNAPLDFPPCVSMLPMRSAEGGSCITLSDPKNVQYLPFFDYVKSIGAIWYSLYDEVRPVPPLLMNDSPTVGLDEQNRVVYLMTYTRADEESQEEVFAMLKELFGEPNILVTQNDEWAPTPYKEISNEWHSAKLNSNIAYWNTKDVWIRYIFDRGTGSGVLALGLKRVLTPESLIPPLYRY